MTWSARGISSGNFPIWALVDNQTVCPVLSFAEYSPCFISIYFIILFNAGIRGVFYTSRPRSYSTRFRRHSSSQGMFLERNTPPIFSNYFSVITIYFWHFNRFSRTFIRRLTNHCMKRVRPTRAAEKGGRIGRISTRDPGTPDRIATGYTFHRAAGTRPNKYQRDDILTLAEILTAGGIC